MKRRNFLKAATLTVAAPLVVPSTLFGQDSPNERITVGIIGVGDRGRGHLIGVQGMKNAQSVAVADCFKSRREGGAAVCKGKAYADFREIIARDDIDCVIIASHCHWHVPMAVAAAKAKKHIYCEKSLGWTIAQNLACEKAVNESGVVFIYGTQQRSQTNCWLGCQLVRQGAIGRVHTIEVDAQNGHTGGSAAPAPIPADLGEDGYDMWVGPAPLRPYSPDRCSFPGTALMYDVSVGRMAGWGSHSLDILVWGSEADLSGPVIVEGTGKIPTEGLYDTVYDWDMKIKLGDVDMVFKPGGGRVRFIGEHGWIEVHRDGTTASDEGLLRIEPENNEKTLTRSPYHMGHFFDCVRDGTTPVSSIRDAVRSDNLTHLCDMAVRTESTVKWDAVKRQLIDPTAEQTAMLDRETREPWTM